MKKYNSYSLILVTKDKGNKIDGVWVQDCTAVTLEEATIKARNVSAVNSNQDIAVVLSNKASSPNYSIQIDLERLDF